MSAVVDSDLEYLKGEIALGHAVNPLRVIELAEGKIRDMRQSETREFLDSLVKDIRRIHKELVRPKLTVQARENLASDLEHIADQLDGFEPNAVTE